MVLLDNGGFLTQLHRCGPRLRPANFLPHLFFSLPPQRPAAAVAATVLSPSMSCLDKCLPVALLCPCV